MACPGPATTSADLRSSQTGLPLAAHPTAPGCARGHVRAVAFEWGLAPLADTAELLASELVTNAVRASRALTAGPVPVVRLWLTRDPSGLVIHVWDPSPARPARRDPGAGDESGRGLMIIESLSDRWGSYPVHDGKVVWARVTLGS